MKKLLLIILFTLIGFVGFSQKFPNTIGVTNNFEDGDWLYYSNLCWGIEPNSTYFNTKVTGNGFNGTNVCETDNLGHSTSCILESPWISFSTGTLIFDHEIPSFDGQRTLKVFIVDQNNISTLLWTYVYTNSTPIHTTIPTAIIGIHKVRWQWLSDGRGNSRGQLDNIIIPGASVSDPSNNCQPYVPPTDTTFINYYPASDTSTLVFEDLWPYYGDYDMNDLVMGYKFKIVSYTTNKVTDIYATFIVRADGAGLHNGFGFQFPNVPSSDIVSVTGVGQQDGYTILTNGTEANQSTSTFIIYDDQYKFMSAWNTVKGGPTCPQVTFNVHIKLVPKIVSLQQLSIQNWNPFIVVGGVRGHEVHLPNYYPTSLVDPSFWGTGNDATNPSQNKWYKSSTNLPWAIDIYGHFYYPTEKSDISNAYLHFQDWVLSNGTQYQDWWSNTGSGYRNNSLIY